MLVNNPAVAPLTVLRALNDQVVNNSEVLVDAPALVLPVGASEVWIVDIVLFVSSPSTTPDIDWLFTVPGGASLVVLDHYGSDMSWPAIVATAELPLANVKPATQFMRTRAVYIGGATPGNVQFRWAQTVATVEDTVLRANSMLVCIKA